MSELDILLNMLVKVVSETTDTREAIFAFFKRVHDNPNPVSEIQAIDELILDLANELDLYEPNPIWRAENRLFYGDDQLFHHIKKAFVDLGALGVKLPPEAERFLQ